MQEIDDLDFVLSAICNAHASNLDLEDVVCTLALFHGEEFTGDRFDAAILAAARLAEIKALHKQRVKKPRKPAPWYRRLWGRS